jgi:sporulation protein YlmC with PRC-barrel domain
MASTDRRAYEAAATGSRAYGGTGYDTFEDDRRELRRRDPQRGQGDVLDDAIPLVGIILGGALGYFAATALGGNMPRFGGGRDSGEQRQSSAGRAGTRHASSGGSHDVSVEHDETTDMIASSKVEGTAVYNRKGEKLGEVYNFMVGKRSGRVAYAVMSFGGFLGIGQKYHAVPWSTLTYEKDKGGYVIDADRDRLMSAPSYGLGEDPFSRPDYGREVQDYWAAGLI